MPDFQLPADTQVNDTCILPFLQGKSFFASHFISISPLPTGLIPGPAETHTLWKNVSQVEPTTLPFPNHHGTARERLGLGLGITFGVLALIAMILMLVWFRRRNFREREVRSILTPSPADKERNGTSAASQRQTKQPSCTTIPNPF